MVRIIKCFFYSYIFNKLIFYTFFNFPNNYKKYYETIHVDLKSYLNVVLLILGLGSIFSGFFFEDLIIGVQTDWLLYTSSNFKINNIDIHLGHLYLNFLAFYYTCLGIFISFVFFLNINFFNQFFIYLYNTKVGFKNNSTNITLFKNMYIFFGKRWYINLMYNKYVASLGFFLGYHETFLLLDKGFFEGISLVTVRQISAISSYLSNNFYRTFYFGEVLGYLFLTYFFFFTSFLVEYFFFF